MFDLTAKHLETFKREFLKWKDWLNLSDWETEFMFDEPEVDAQQEARAMCIVQDLENRQAVIYLSGSWDIKPTVHALRRTAFHECLELRFMRLNFLASSRSVREEDITEEVHSIIRCLENRVFPKDGEKKGNTVNGNRSDSEEGRRQGRRG